MIAWASAWRRKLIEEIMYEMKIINMLHYELYFEKITCKKMY
jgi:hypothetical protein